MSVRILFSKVALAAGLLLSGCGGAEQSTSSPISQWCTDPPKDGTGNAVMTLVKKPDASLPAKVAVQFNGKEEATFVDDGTGLDAKAGDGIYTHAAKVPVTPTEHYCNNVVEGAQSTALSTELSALQQAISVMGSCSVRTCNTCLGASLGLPCVCVSCNVTVTF